MTSHVTSCSSYYTKCIYWTDKYRYYHMAASYFIYPNDLASWQA